MMKSYKQLLLEQESDQKWYEPKNKFSKDSYLLWNSVFGLIRSTIEGVQVPYCDSTIQSHHY